MKKAILVLKNEFIITVTRRSFLLIAFGIPLISGLVFAVLSRANRSPHEAGVVSQVLSVESPKSPVPEGYVDQAHLIRYLPTGSPEGSLQSFSDETAAQQALQAGRISAYTIIPADYIRSGRLFYIRPDFNPLSAFGQSSAIDWVLQVNLLGGDTRLAAQVNHPLRLEQVSLSPTPQRSQENPLTFFLPYAVTMMYYLMILMSSSFLLNSLTKEKENRVMEILMSSITPRQLLVGKITGLGLVGLVQAALWVGTGYALLRLSGRSFSLPAAFQLPPSFLAWGLVFFLLGYGLYASLMASVGALVPNLREASHATFVVILPLILPLMLISILVQEPNGALATLLSLFPLTSPVVMMMRLSATQVPLGQMLLSTALLAATAALTIRAVAGMFRAQTLLTGQGFNLKRLLSLLVGLH